MIAQEINHPQRSKEWLESRLGKLTSSNIKLILGNPKKKGEVLTQTAQNHLLTLISQIMTGEAVELTGRALEWGKDHEDEAVKTYEAETMTKVKECSLFD